MYQAFSYLMWVGLVLTVNSGVVAQETGRGNILIEYWWDGGIDNNLDNLINHQDFPNNPHASEWRRSFNRPDVPWTNYFGARVRGYLHPPEDGDYTFYIYSNDDGELFLDMQHVAEVRGGWTAINEWDKFSTQKGGPIFLEAGKQYSMEALYVDGQGPGIVGVGWSGPVVGDEPMLIEGKYLTPFIRDPEPLLMAKYTYPENGTILSDTWLILYWEPGPIAISHNVYLGENYSDVLAGTGDTLQGNLSTEFFVVGFPGYPYPDGLVPGSTYYWRIDEVNEAEPSSPWKGDVWSFSILPKKAYEPCPANNGHVGLHIDRNVFLSWRSGINGRINTLYFGDSFADVEAGTGGTLIRTTQQSETTFMVGPLNPGTTYYWRVDEAPFTVKGDVWSFTAKGAIIGSNPANGDVDVKTSTILSWHAGTIADSYEIYFGTDADAVANATKTSPEYKGSKALGEESFDPGKLTLNTTYYWRIDGVNDTNPESFWPGNVWSFTTGDFFVIDDFEDYDGGNPIWYSWYDGLGYGSPGTAYYYAGNGTGSDVGDETTLSTTEETIVHGGNQSMPLFYDNNKQGCSKYSQTELTLTALRDWTEGDIANLSLWFRGLPGPVGSFVEEPTGTYTMTATGADIWNQADEFHFAYKTLTGAGSIIAKVNSVDNTNTWAKAGVMIRESLNPDSAHAFACITPSNGVASQYRPSTGGTSGNYNQTGIAAPYWVKLERNISGLFTVSHSANGTSWQPVTGAVAQNISMSSNVYIGLAVTARNAAATCQAVFSDVTTTGNVTGQWAHQDIGILSNDAEPLYVAVSNGTGTTAVFIHDNPAVATIDTWTEWIIPLSAIADQGINLTNVDRIAIGLGTKGNMTIPGGSGKMFFDDIRLGNVHIYEGALVPEEISRVKQGNLLSARSVKLSDSSKPNTEKTMVLASDGTYRVGSKTDECDNGSSGDAGPREVDLDGYVRDMFTGNKLHKNTKATVTLKPGPFSDDINSKGHYWVQPFQGTYRVTVTANSYIKDDSNTQFKLCKDTERDFLLKQTQEPNRPVYRFLSPTGSKKGQYFCTVASSERNELLFHTDDWEYKGIAFCAEVPDTTNAQPVHRFWSKWKKLYYYTIDQDEKQQLIDENSVVWELDKENAFWAYQDDQPEMGLKPVYHFWSPTLERHFYTIDPDEMDDKPEYTIVEEKPVAWYAYDPAGNP